MKNMLKEEIQRAAGTDDDVNESKDFKWMNPRLKDEKFLL